MSIWKKLVLFSCFCIAALSGGCSPMVICQVETVVFPDYSCERVTRIEAWPSPRFPQQRPRLADYFQFPPAEYYDTYSVQQDKVLFAGDFESYEKIPVDMIRTTPGTTSVAGNLMSFRVMDMVLFVLADFDETLTDIVKSQEDGEAALFELLRLTVPEVMSVLNAKYGQKYDLSRLESYLYNDLPAKLRRVYAAAWAIHSAKRSGVTSPGEDFEYYLFLQAEAKREGLELAEYGSPDMQQENIRRLKEYGIQLAQRLCPPRQGGQAPDKEMLAGISMDELLASIQSAITARHGSVNNFINKIAALVPRAFGTYVTGTVMPIYMLPETRYQYRLRVPGKVIQTNGVQEMNGDMVWNFADRDLAFTGQSMWARTIFVREPAVYALGLRGFPDSLADVDKMFGLSLTPQGAPREGLLQVLRQAVADRSLRPVEALAASGNADAAAARSMLELFESHRRRAAAPAAQPQQAQPTAPAPAPQPAAPIPVPQPELEPQSPPVAPAQAPQPQPMPAAPVENPLAPMQPLQP